MDGDKLVFRGLIASPDGKLFYDTTREGKPEDAVEMGHDAGMELKVRTVRIFPPCFGHFSIQTYEGRALYSLSLSLPRPALVHKSIRKPDIMRL